ncbi:MAG TPA: hypothetical protein PLK34_03000 [Candidatus Pacearchaeota archaeon]|nr:hypothetical protein [Candidatus Pacearchaeota archaeon]
MIFKKNKSGVSEVITTLLLVLLTMALLAVVYMVLRPYIENQLRKSGSCFQVADKVKLNDLSTCQNASTGDVLFFIEVGETKALTKILVVISSDTTSDSIEITNIPQQISNLEYYDGTTNVAIPGENSGILYVYHWGDFGYTGSGKGIPKEISLVPMVGQDDCAIADSINLIDPCSVVFG